MNDSSSLNIVLIKLMLHSQLRCIKSIHRYEPPNHIPITKHVNQFVKIRLLLELYQLLVPNFLM